MRLRFSSRVRLFFGYPVLHLAAWLLKVPHIKTMYQDQGDLILTLSSRPVEIRGLDIRKGGQPLHQSGILAPPRPSAKPISLWDNPS